MALETYSGGFPRQKRTAAEKNENFFKECIEAAVGMAQRMDSIQTSLGVRSSKKEKIVCYNLYDDIVDKKEVELTLDPLGIFNTDKFPTTYRNYPLVNPNINLLCGEERRRPYNPVVTVINGDAVTSKLEQKKELFTQWYVEQLQRNIQDEEKLKMELEKFSRFINYSWKDLRERMGTQLLNYLCKTLDLSQEFSRGFKDLLITGEEIYTVEIEGGNPVLRRVDPTNVTVIRGSLSWKIEDANIIVEDAYLSVGKVLDRYYEYLTPQQISDIENGYATVRTGTKMLVPEIPTQSLPNIEFIDLTNMGSADINKFYNLIDGYYDAEGNIRVTRVLWKGMRKVNIVYSFDEDGQLVKDIMPEQYKPNKEMGEQVKEAWINEWYEGIRIGKDIYIKMGPCELQIRDLDNPSKVYPPFVGSIVQTGKGTSKGLMGIAKEWQYLWNTFMYKLKLAYAKDYGKIGFLPLHLFPDGWSMDQIYFWGTQLGLLPLDAFNAGQEGFAKGKLAGTMSGIPTHMDLSNQQQIQSYIAMLAFIKEQVDNLTGITPQRKGAISSSETVGGIERSVLQSSNITEEWFSIHDNTKTRALRLLLEAAKIAYEGKSFVKEFILDEGTKGVLEFDYNIYKEACYGVDVSNSADDQATVQYLKSLADRFLQASGSFALAAELARTKDPATIIRTIADYETKMQEQRSQAAQAQQEAALQIEQQKMELEMMKLEVETEQRELDRQLEMWKAQEENQTRITVAELNAYRMTASLDQNSNGIPDPMEIADQARKERELQFKEFGKKMEQETKKKEVEFKKQVEDKKIELENKKLELEKKKLALQEKAMKLQKEIQKKKDEAAMEREKLKAKVAIQNKVPGEK